MAKKQQQSLEAVMAKIERKLDEIMEIIRKDPEQNGQSRH